MVCMSSCYIRHGKRDAEVRNDCSLVYVDISLIFFMMSFHSVDCTAGERQHTEARRTDVCQSNQKVCNVTEQRY